MIISVQAKLDMKGVNIEVLDEAFVGQFNKAVANLAFAARDRWISIAQESLHTSRADYIKGLTHPDSYTYKTPPGKEIHEIQLVGRMANNFEFGMPEFDMKTVRPGWLGGGKSRMGADGKRYIVIPFRHSTTSNSNIRYTGKAAKDNLKVELKRVVRQYGLDKMVRTATGKVVEGPVTRVPNKAPDVHSYLRGLVRMQKGVGGVTSTGLQRGQSQLMTFRVMSENSPELSWIHPGLDAANLLPEVERYIDNELNKLIDVMFAE